MHQLLLARAEARAGKPAGAERLRFIRSCSASLPPQVMHDLEAAFGAPVLEAYGMTEAAHQMASNPLPPGARKPGSVGPRHRRAASASWTTAGKHLAAGERGEVVIQGPNVIRGYENNPEANATSFIDGWFRTGDQGFLDADGYLTLVGRLKELINRGGEKISPREIDEVLLAHPAVAEAVCFGVPHPTWGEEVAAAVVLREARRREADLLAYCRERLADFKRPKQIHITRHDSAHGDRQDPARASSRRRFRPKRVVKFVIVGAGAIGGYIGAKLARAGADVTLFARGPHLRAMQERGLRVLSPDGDFEVQPQVIGDLATIGRADVVFLGVKAHSLTALAPQLRPLLGPDTVVVSTQNGIPWWYFQGTAASSKACSSSASIRAASIASAIEPRRVIGSLAYFSTDIVEPGVIRHIEGNEISFGEPDGTESERCRAIAEPLIAAGLRCPINARFRHEIWVKLLGNVAFNPISALTGGDARGAGARIRRSARVVRDVMAETEAVAAQARHRAADLDRSADGRRRESRRAQDVDAAGSRSRPADGNRGRRRRGGRARRSARRADAGDADGLRVREAARHPFTRRSRRVGWCTAVTEGWTTDGSREPFSAKRPARDALVAARRRHRVHGDDREPAVRLDGTSSIRSTRAITGGARASRWRSRCLSPPRRGSFQSRGGLSTGSVQGSSWRSAA